MGVHCVTNAVSVCMGVHVGVHCEASVVSGGVGVLSGVHCVPGAVIVQVEECLCGCALCALLWVRVLWVCTVHATL